MNNNVGKGDKRRPEDYELITRNWSDINWNWNGKPAESKSIYLIGKEENKSSGSLNK